MEIVKQYLEKRIKQLQRILLNKETTVIHYREAYSSFKELEQVLTLFNEEYKKQNKKVSDINKLIADLYDNIFPKQTF